MIRALKILFTGGTGTLGRELLPVLLEHYSVICVGRNKPELEHPNLEYKYFNFYEDKELDISSKVDIILHVAGLASGEGKDKDEYLKINANSVNVLLKLQETNKIKKFIYASSTSVYGSEQRPYYEIDHLNGKTDYAISKIQGEMNLVQSGLPFLILRLSSIYGKNGKSYINKLLNLAEKRVIPFPNYGKTTRSFVYIKDAVACISIAIRKDLFGIYNLCHPQPVTFYELANTIHYYFPKTFKFPIPRFIYKLDKLFSKLMNRTPKLKPLFESSIINSNKIMKDLSYQFKFSFQKGFKDILDNS
ncbi:MAG: NAD(P)-dependent oxidoreductase [Leptospiraceae bacterium]|nr:NAD(P)-dependent oxidoreductase [Leptospiraceae bacterium]